MGTTRGPLGSLVDLEGVEGVSVLSPSGEVLMVAPDSPEVGQWMEGLQRYACHPDLLHKLIKEVVAFYPGVLLIWRNLLGSKVVEDGFGLEGRSKIQWAQEERRILVLRANRTANLALLRMNLDVMEHSWRSQGIDRVFPLSKGKTSKGGFFSRLVGKKRP